MKRSSSLLAILLLLGCAWIFLRNPPRPVERGNVGANHRGTHESPPQPADIPAAQTTDFPRDPVRTGEAKAPANPSVADKASSPTAPAIVRRSIPITADYVRQLVNGPDAVSITLPDGRTIQGRLEIQERGPLGEELGVTGRITSPVAGRFNFYLESPEANRGPVSGAVVIDQEEMAFSVQPGPDNSALLTELPVDLVICRSYAPVPAEESAAPEEALPTEHPTSIGIPAYQNGVIPLQSNPGVTRVIYLDFDGEKGPFSGWGNFDASPSGASNTTIKDVWVRVCEDYAPFNVNITTDLQVFLNAPTTSRQRIIITPTTDAAPGAGGVAYVNEYGSSSGRPCWSFYSSGKNSAEVIAHEVGHTLGLSHDGRSTPSEGYYLGHGTDPVGWAPIMGAGYYKNLSQWSKGEYPFATNTQDDLAIIAGKLTYRTDDAGADHATAATLEVFGTGTVDTEGVIERTADVDAFKFTTTGGAVNLTIADASTGPNLDISASLYDSSNTLILTNNPDTAVTASLSTTLAAGDYTVRVDGVGRGDIATDGYSDYGSLGQYTITGTIAGALVPSRFTIAETATSGSSVGTPTLRNDHTGATLTYAISTGNTGNAFAIDSSTGLITVATPSALNYETLSANWLDPATLDLTVTVTDSVNPLLNETLRVVVTVTNVNEAPTITGPSSIAVISHTLTGTALGTYLGTDPDRYDQCSYSIASGNSAGKFAITSAGVLTANGDLDSTVLSSYTLTLRATDKGTPGLTSDTVVAITVVPCSTAYTPGYANHTLYESITGSTIANLTGNAAFPASPTREVKLLEFTDTTRGDNYGSSVRAWLIAPYTGTYQFWISGDNVAELYLNTAGATTPLTLGGSVTAATNYQTFTTSGSQTVGTYSLTAGQVCYIEARHKEVTGGDHLSVAWQIKDASNVNTIVAQQIIPGRYLSPHYLSYNATNAVAATAGLVEEFWDGITGTSLSTLTSLPNFPNKPDRVSDLIAFNTISGGTADNYGARIRAYVIPPSTGPYTFYISGDDATSLLLSTDSTPANATQVAYSTSNTGYQNWTAFSTQTSTPVTLNAGQKYFIEARVKEAAGGDHVSVAWSGGSIGTTATVIADATYSQPYDSNIAPSFGSASYSFTLPANYSTNTAAGTVTATDASFEDVRYAIISGDSRNAFAINPATGAISVSNLSTLSIGSTYNLQVGAQDSGHGRHFTPKETLVPVSIVVPGTNVAPQFTASPIALGSFPAGQAISPSIAAFVTDPGDAITFSLVSGPAWISLSSAGVFSGTPGYTAFGPHTITVAANDGNGHTVNGTVTLTVSAPANVPVSTLLASSSTTTLTTGTVNSGTTTNASTSDNSYHILKEASASGTSALDYRWTFTNTPNRPATLRVEAHHSTNTEGDDFQFSVSTDGGTTFTNAILVTKTSDDNSVQTYAYTAGSTGTTIVKVLDANRTAGRTTLDTLSIDLLAIDQAANNVPATTDATYQVASHTPVGVTVGSAAATSSDAGQTLTYSIPRGNEAGLFSVSSTGDIKVAADIPTGSATYSLIVVATDNGVPSLANYATITVNVVAPIAATITLGNLTPTYNGSAQAVTATTSPPGKAVAITYNGSATVPTNAGSYTIAATIMDPLYAGSASATQVIAKASATITLSGLSQTYDGTAKSATATTSPAGQTVSLTYNSSLTAPTAAGSYAVSAIITSTNYQGSTTGNLVIAKASATVTLSGLSQTYTGSPRIVTATTSPASLSVDLTYAGSPTAPTAAGSYAIVGTINSSNYTGSSSGTLVVGKATATVTLAGLSQTYTGTARTVTASTTPPGLSTTITYNGSGTAPTAAGSYPIVATVNDANYLGSNTGTLVVAKASATITLGSLSQTYNGSPKAVTVTTSPPGLAATTTYDATSTIPSLAGSYALSSTITDPNYTGSATGTLVINKATATLTLSGLSQAYDGSSKSVTVTTLPGGLSYDLTYDGSPTAPSAAGSHAVSVTITEANYTGSATGTLEITSDLIVAAAQSMVLPNNTSTYQNLVNDGTLVLGAGTVHITVDATNHGLLRLTGDAVLDVSGTFTNTGVIDIINWSGTLPPGLVNSGTILDRSAIRVTSTQASVTTFTLSVPSYAGHLYQLETKTDLSAAWQPLGSSVAGTGSATNPPALQFSPTLNGPRHFYRVVVTPAP